VTTYLLAGGGKPIASTIPQEGATGWADTTMMHANAPHPNCAYMWLEPAKASNPGWFRPAGTNS